MPVIYLVEPTPENVKLITSDLERGLYSPAYINFLSSVPRPVLEDFASQVAATGVAESITQVYDQYLNFVVSEPDLFSLGMGKETYWALNGNNVADQIVDDTVDRIVSGLFSVVVTMGTSYSTVANYMGLLFVDRRHSHYKMSTQGSCRSCCRKTRQETS